MFAAVGNHMEALHRSRIGGLTLGALPEGEWRMLNASDLDTPFNAITSMRILERGLCTSGEQYQGNDCLGEGGGSWLFCRLHLRPLRLTP